MAKLTPAQIKANAAAKAKAAAAAKAKAAADAQKIADAAYAKIQSSYGLTDALLNTDQFGSLKAAFEQIRAQKITDPTIAANILAGTEWFKTHGVQVTQNLALEQTSPGIFQQNVDAIKEQIRDEAAKIGKALSETDLNAIAKDAFIYGKAYDASQVINDIVAKGTGTGGGTYGTTINDLKSYTANMGVSYNDSWYTTAADKVAAGDMTLADYQAEAKAIAKSKYQGFATQIDQGMTVQDIASPYMQSMAKLLEIPWSSIGLNDTTINQALTSMGSNGTPQAQPLWQFETNLRKDPRWAQTQNARATVDSTARSILQTFGLVS
jgi:hypothetical protein